MAEEVAPRPQRRATDAWLCRAAEIGRHFWEWVENRKIVEKFLALVITASTIRTTEWAYAFAALHPDSAAMVAACTAPAMAVQAAAVAFLLKPKADQ